MDKLDKDFMRYALGNAGLFRKVIILCRNKILRAIFYSRFAEKQSVFSGIFQFWSRRIFTSRGIEIGNTRNIQGGLCFIHAYSVTINSRAIVGENFTIFKGATVGSIRSGAKRGAPIIGNRVTICTNAFVCGNITIGDDVLIAANAFVNFDVPSNSIVIGNPGVIYHKNNPSLDYLPSNVNASGSS